MMLTLWNLGTFYFYSVDLDTMDITAMYTKGFSGYDETIFDSTGKIYLRNQYSVYKIVDGEAAQMTFPNMGAAKAIAMDRADKFMVSGFVENTETVNFIDVNTGAATYFGGSHCKNNENPVDGADFIIKYGVNSITQTKSGDVYFSCKLLCILYLCW